MEGKLCIFTSDIFQVLRQLFWDLYEKKKDILEIMQKPAKTIGAASQDIALETWSVDTLKQML